MEQLQLQKLTVGEIVANDFSQYLKKPVSIFAAVENSRLRRPAKKTRLMRWNLKMKF